MTATSEPVVVVTGGARGIGLEVVRAFAHAGYRVVTCDADVGLNGTVDMVNREIGAEIVTGLRGDVEQLSTLDSLAELAAATGQPHALVNNAALVMLQRSDATTVVDFERAIHVNVRAYWYLTMKLRDDLRTSGSGAVVNIGSTHPWQTKRASFPYNITKGAVLALTKSLAVDLGPEGIRVNSVVPGIVDTQPTRDWIATQDDPDATHRSVLDDHPLQRLPTMVEVAAAVLFLCSSAASGISGTELVVDCGRHAQRR